MYRESSFYANAGSDTTYGEHFTHTCATAGDANAFKQLNTFTGTFDYFYINFQSVAGTEFRNVGTQLFLFNCFDDVHLCSSSESKTFILSLVLTADRPLMHTLYYTIQTGWAQEKGLQNQSFSGSFP